MRFLAILLLFPASVFAADWEATDTALLSGALTATVIDWGQTRTIAKNPQKFYEHNPILGQHPSVGAVDRYFGVAILGTVGLSVALPRTYRRWFLGGVIVVESVYVIHNHGVGIRASF